MQQQWKQHVEEAHQREEAACLVAQEEGVGLEVMGGQVSEADHQEAMAGWAAMVSLVHLVLLEVESEVVEQQRQGDQQVWVYLVLH